MRFSREITFVIVTKLVVLLLIWAFFFRERPKITGIETMQHIITSQHAAKEASHG